MLPYPSIPARARTGLLLFGAYFQGRNDGENLRDAWLTCTVVDIDQTLLDKMAETYPPDWTFICQDAFEFIDQAIARGEMWDVVSADPSRPEMPRTVAKRWEICSLSRMLCVIGDDHEDALTTGWLVCSGREPDSGRAVSWIYR